MEPNHQILFIGNGADALPFMAAGLATRMSHSGIDFMCATLVPAQIDSIADDVMKEIGIDISGQTLLTLHDIKSIIFDLVITIGPLNRSEFLNLPGMPPRLHWDIPDTDPGSAEEILRTQLCEARDQLKAKVQDLFSSQLLAALFGTRQKLELILDNLVDGVMAHTANRHIFFFNQAAEQITGYRREELLGRDCHDVFPGRFCGGDCDFCNGEEILNVKSVAKREVVFTQKDGAQKALKMSVMPLADDHEKNVGALLSFKDVTELNLLKNRVKHHHALGGLIGKDPNMIEIFNQIREVGSVMVPVLIEGETGTGKETVARAIHDIGPLSQNPFLSINCGALPEASLENEITDYIDNRFSNADPPAEQRNSFGHGGTLFLDEINMLSLAMQIKLLRALKNKRLETIAEGSFQPQTVRVICATNQNLRQLMESKHFRRDLYYRLCVYPIKLPPLRERRLDISVLVDHFLERTAQKIGRPILIVSNEALDLMIRYPWPGNVAELQNAIEFAYVKCRQGAIGVENLPTEITNFAQRSSARPGPALKKKEQVMLAVATAEGNKKKAAQILGVSRATFYRYLDTYNLK